MHSVAWAEVDGDDLYDTNASQVLLDPEQAGFDDLVRRWVPSNRAHRKFEDVPSHIASAASEAHDCLAIDGYRAAMMLARAVIEATATDKSIHNGNLASKIDSLCAAQLIRPAVRDAAHEVRHLGNDMAHGDFVDAVAVEDAEAALGIMCEILNEVFQGPARVATLRAKRDAKAARP